MKTKKCCICQEVKFLDQFNKRSKSKDGLNSCCKICSRKQCRKHAANRRDKKTEYMRKYRKTENGKKSIQKMRNSLKFKNRLKKWREENFEHIREVQKTYEANNKQNIIQKRQEWRDKNRKKIRKQRRDYMRNRMRNDPIFKMRMNISRDIKKALKQNKNGRHWENIVGYTLQELKNHIESLFQPNMSWNNYGKWQIDHIIPQSFFEFTSYEDTEFKMCWRLENLQPLWAKDNLKKRDKLPSHK